MDLKERLTDISQLMKETKEKWVETDPEDLTLGIYLHFWRDADLVAAVQCMSDRDVALKAAYLAAAGFNASMLSMSFECWHSTLPDNPMTGKHWRPHEMQYVGEQVPEAVEKGWVSEAIATSIHDREGEYVMHTQPFRIVDGTLEWGEPSDIFSSKEGEGASGIMFDSLSETMAAPLLFEMVKEQQDSDPMIALLKAMELDEELRYFHADMGTLKALEEKDLATGIVLMANDGSRRAEWIEERLGPPDA